MSFIIDDESQEQYDKLKQEYLSNIDNCIAYYSEEIEDAVKALKSVAKKINENGHNIEICELIDIV